MIRPAVVALAAVVFVACERAPAVPPYGLDALADQRFRIEANAETVVDGEPARVERLADVRLSLRGVDGPDVELELFLERYFMHVRGGPREETQVAISEKGFVSRDAGGTDLRLEPTQEVPSAPSVLALLARPLSGVALDSFGAQRQSVWHSAEPLLREVELLAWLLLALPVASEGDVDAWNGSREVPAIGRYRLGVELPIRFERERPGVVRARGSAERDSLELADGFAGRVGLRHEGRSELGPRGELIRAELELALRFDGVRGTTIRSTHKLVIACLDCDVVQISPEEPRSN